jgi:predicted nucleic acid-binding protein
MRRSDSPESRIVRTLVDANVLVSFLIPPSNDKPRPIRRLLPAIVSHGGVLLVADETLNEVRATVETKPWFRGKVSAVAIQDLFAA